MTQVELKMILSEHDVPASAYDLENRGLEYASRLKTGLSREYGLAHVQF
jgi:hypothetical protein